MRRGLELRVVALPAFAGTDWDDVLIQVSTLYSSALDIKFAVAHVDHPGTRISTDTLNSLVEEPISESRWQATIVAADQLAGFDRQPLGLMFDNQFAPYRQGAVLLMGALRGYADPAVRHRTIIRTFAHELGHLLNLCHCDANPADDWSDVMRPGRPDAEDVPQRLSLSATAIDWLTAGPSQKVRPGTSEPYGKTCCGRNVATSVQIEGKK